MRAHDPRLRCAARAGTDSPWFTGADPEDLKGFANIRDVTAGTIEPKWRGGVSFDDGHKGIARAGTFGPNGWGLHDVHGNVWEWVRDRFGRASLPLRARDGERTPGPARQSRVARGGSYISPVRETRVSRRFHDGSTFRHASLGVRPAR